MGFLAQYDFDQSYNLGKENMVTDIITPQASSMPETKSERNHLVFAMIREYQDLESMVLSDIGYTMDAQSGQEFAMIRVLTMRPYLIEEIVYAQGWDYFSCQTVDDLIVGDID